MSTETAEQRGPEMIEHGRVLLALHQVRGARDAAANDRPLLVLHGLGESTPAVPPGVLEPWPGPIYGLDFTGHGASSVPAGGGYTCEVLVADADRALAHLGSATVFGRGLGAYVGLLLAGIRTEQVVGVILDDGPGLLGGGPESLPPGSAIPVEMAANPGRVASTPDPYALMELARDVRPPDYAAIFARFALERSPLDLPITVTAVVRPPWLAAVVAEPGVAVADVRGALARYER